MSNRRGHLCTRFLLVLLAVGGFSAAAQTRANPELEVEVHKMISAAGWPRMVEIALERGDLQRGAKRSLDTGSARQMECVDENYTANRVLDRIFIGYLLLYSDPEIVADITRFYESPGGKRILDKVAERSKMIGAEAAYAESRNSEAGTLTPEERMAFSAFAESPAGKAYLELRPRQLAIHQAQLILLTNEVVKECRE